MTFENKKLDTYGHRYEEDVLREHAHQFDYADWLWVSYHQKISPKFVDDFVNYISFDELSNNPYIDECFFEKYKDKVGFISISFHGKLSRQFIEKYIKKLSIKLLLLNENVPKDVREEIKLLKEII